jgi:hypothetical protein
VGGLKILADVLGRPAALAEGQVGGLGELQEDVAPVEGCEGLEECLERRREAVVCLVRRGPERVAADLGKGADLERGVVGGNVLKGDVRVLGVS